MYFKRFKNIFWLTVILTAISYINLFRIVGPNADPQPVIIASIIAVLLSISSITVILTYIVKRKPARPTAMTGIVAAVGLLFGIFLSAWYIIDAFQRL